MTARPSRARALAWALAATLLSLFAAPGPARSELLEVRQVAGGMECPECARALQLRVKALSGIDAAATSWNRRVLTARLRDGNHTTLAQIRALVLAQHFQIREAEIVVAGRLVSSAGGTMSLQVPETGINYHIDLGSLAGAARAGWQSRLVAAAGASIVLTGRVPGSAGGEDPQILWPIDLKIRAPGS